MNEDINEDINLKIMKLSNARGELYEELEHHEEGSEAFNRIYETIKAMLKEESGLIDQIEITEEE